MIPIRFMKDSNASWRTRSARVQWQSSPHLGFIEIVFLRSVKRNARMECMESAHLVKAFALLEATAGREEGRSLAELAADVGLPKSTAHRLLKTLCALGYMVNSGAGVYRQTSLLRRVANGQEDSKLVELAFPIIEALHHRTGQTINLGVLRFERVVYLSVRKRIRSRIAWFWNG